MTENTEEEELRIEERKEPPAIYEDSGVKNRGQASISSCVWLLDQ